MSTVRKFFVGGNWKMNGSKKSIDDLVKLLNEKGVNPNAGIRADNNMLSLHTEIGIFAFDNRIFIIKYATC